METPPGPAAGMAGVGSAGLKSPAVQGILERLTPGKHSRLASKQTLVSLITGLLLFVPSETILAVKRPPYPIRAEVPDAGHWIIISTTEKIK
jgi:hypothetical protein